MGLFFLFIKYFHLIDEYFHFEGKYFHLSENTFISRANTIKSETSFHIHPLLLKTSISTLFLMVY